MYRLWTGLASLAARCGVRDDAPNTLCVEAGRGGCCGHPHGDHRVRADLRQPPRPIPTSARRTSWARCIRASSHSAPTQPVYPPWYLGDNPASGEGFEAAIAYAVAAKMNYARDHVRWVRVPFNAALAPGPKTFDANLSEFSITEQRKAAVDFSSPYFDVTQAVVTVRSSPAAGAKTV